MVILCACLCCLELQQDFATVAENTRWDPEQLSQHSKTQRFVGNLDISLATRVAHPPLERVVLGARVDGFMVLFHAPLSLAPCGASPVAPRGGGMFRVGRAL